MDDFKHYIKIKEINHLFELNNVHIKRANVINKLLDLLKKNDLFLLASHLLLKIRGGPLRTERDSSELIHPTKDDESRKNT